MSLQSKLVRLASPENRKPHTGTSFELKKLRRKKRKKEKKRKERVQKVKAIEEQNEEKNEKRRISIENKLGQLLVGLI